MLIIWVNLNKAFPLFSKHHPQWQRFKERNRCKIIRDALPGRRCFLIIKKKGGWWGKEDANLGLRLNLCLFYLITQALFMFTPSHLAISQTDDVSNWKAWNTLERSLQRNSHTFTYLGWVPNGKKKKGMEPVLEEEQRSFLW